MRKARDIKEQLVELCKRVEIDYDNEDISKVDDDLYTNVRKAILSGYFYNTAKIQKSGDYKTLKNAQIIYIHPSSCMFEALPKWIIFHELILTSKEYMRNVIEIDSKWLLEIAPHYYKESDLKDQSKK